MKKLKCLLAVLATASLTLLPGCQGQGEQAAEPAEATVAQAETAVDQVMPAGEHVHGLRCGCSIEGIGKCGNYIEVEGEFVELVLPETTSEELGKMPFCGQSDLMANVEGEVVDGKFVATAFDYVEP